MLKVLELFGGIGACTSALKRLPIDFEVVDYVEIDKYAVKSYNAINNTDYKPQDIQEWDKNLNIDLIMHGSPCQDFSIAGQQKGADKDSETRSSLMYETLRIVEKLKPKYVIWENVKNVLSEQHKHNFIDYLHSLERLGYYNYYQVLNAKDYGVPQNRERIFVISILGYKIFEFPEKEYLKIKLKDILESNVDEKYYLSEKAIKYFTKISKREHRNEEFKPLSYKSKIGNTITARPGQRVTDNFIIQTPRGFNKGGQFDICPTITSNSWEYNNLLNNVRKLTPIECWRLMGFIDQEFKRAEQVNSNTQLYKQAGNSIVVNVLEKILYNLLIKDYKSKDTQLSVMDLMI